MRWQFLRCKGLIEKVSPKSENTTRGTVAAILAYTTSSKGLRTCSLYARSKTRSVVRNKRENVWHRRIKEPLRIEKPYHDHKEQKKERNNGDLGAKRLRRKERKQIGLPRLSEMNE